MTEPAGVGGGGHNVYGVQAQGVGCEAGGNSLHTLTYGGDARVDLDTPVVGYPGQGRLAGLVAAGEIGPTAQADAEEPVISRSSLGGLVVPQLLVAN